MTSISTIFKGFLHLIYPELCYMCWKESPAPNNKLCVSCMLDMPYTTDFDKVHNHVSNHFFGRVPIAHAAALLNYFEDSNLTEMLHKLKYRSKKDVGVYLGKLLGAKIKASKMYPNIDAITYVPLHPEKQRKRGYNQSRLIASGVSSIIEAPILDNLLYKKINNASQTQKSRLGRLKNVDLAFGLKDSIQIKDLSILIVDDVVTTGATLEACCKQLVQGGCKRISIACAAVARS